MMIKTLLRIRRVMKRKKPDFLRQNWFKFPKLGEKWRRPKGRHSKLRKHEKERGALPSPGYRSPKAVRGLHPSGLKEVRVFNVNDLENLDPKKHAIRIAAQVGKKKRMEIIKEAEKLGIRVLNKGNIEAPTSKSESNKLKDENVPVEKEKGEENVSDGKRK